MTTQLVIFGITGDLSRRKLLPALESIVQAGESLDIIGVSRRNVEVSELFEANTALAQRTTIVTMDLASKMDYEKLAAHLGPVGDNSQRLYYLSVPPGAAATIADFLGAAGLNSPHEKVLFEKPFGFDLESAKEFIARTARYYDESQIFRIDHYMAKEVAQEVIRVRSDAANHHHSWGAETVERVEVVAHESIGVGSRGIFYDQTGAIRDVIQGHLMQLLSLVLMDPSTIVSENLPTARLHALQRLKPVKQESVHTAQYEGYLEDIGQSHSSTETYAKMTLYSDDPRWAQVPLVLETGKKMPEKRTYIRVIYKDGSEDVFDEATVCYGDERCLNRAYEHVLLSAISNERAIFTTSEEVLESWRVLAGYA